MRLITRANLDGVTCAVLITQMEQIEQVVFADPKDIEDGAIAVNPGDAVANLPYHHNAALWFDHKSVDTTEEMRRIKGLRKNGPSAARMVYEYYETLRLRKYDQILKEVDRIDSANLTKEDVLNPNGWVLLSYTLDPFMGMDEFHGYANEIILAIKTGCTIGQLLDMPMVKGRVGRYLLDAEDFKTELEHVTTVDGNVLITDFRKVDLMPIGNRFIAFALYPDTNVQIRISQRQRAPGIRIQLGKNIFNRSCDIHLGEFAAEYDGGGLKGAAGFLLDPKDADQRIPEIISRLKE